MQIKESQITENYFKPESAFNFQNQSDLRTLSKCIFASQTFSVHSAPHL